jgi:ABC-2 type transport system permease protein
MSISGFTIYKIAGNEIRHFMSNPLIIIVSCILLIFAVLNGMGDARMLHSMEKNSPIGDVFISVGLSQVIFSSTFFCTIVAVFLGATSMAENRTHSVLGLLLTKPLYRRDVVAGKFLGLNVLLFAMVAANQIVCSLLLMVYFRPPLAFEDFILRLSTYIVLFFEASLCMGLMMIVGTVFRELLKVTLLSITFLYIDWYSFLPNKLGVFNVLSPKLWAFIVTRDLLITSIPYTGWLGDHFQHILLIIVMISLIFLVECYVFAGSDKL